MEQLKDQSAEISETSEELLHLRGRYHQVFQDLDATWDDRNHLRESHAQALRHVFFLEQQLQEAYSRKQRLRSEHFQVRRRYHDACDELIRSDRAYAALLEDQFRSLLCELQDRHEETRTQTSPILLAPSCAREAILVVLGMVDQWKPSPPQLPSRLPRQDQKPENVKTEL